MFWKKKKKVWKCPRCGTEHEYNKKGLENMLKLFSGKPYQLCLRCFAPLKFEVEGDKIVSVERIQEQVELEIPVDIDMSDESITFVKEKSMLDSEYEYLKKILGILDGVEMARGGEKMIAFGRALQGKPDSVYWQLRSRGGDVSRDGGVDPWKEDLNRIYVKYPHQTQVIAYYLNKSKHLVSLSKQCFRCGGAFPKSLAKCPFCGYS